MANFIIRGGNIAMPVRSSRSKTGRDYTQQVHPVTYVFRHIDLSIIICSINRQIRFAGPEQSWRKAEFTFSIRMIKNQIGIHSFGHCRRPVAELRQHSQTGNCQAKDLQRHVHEPLRLAHYSKISSNPAYNKHCIDTVKMTTGLEPQWQIVCAISMFSISGVTMSVPSSS